MRIAALLLAPALLLGAERRASSQLVVQVRPEVSLTQPAPDTLLLKIRLHTGTTAELWPEEACGARQAGGIMVQSSGTFVLPLPAAWQTAKNVCLASSDGALTAVLPLHSR